MQTWNSMKQILKHRNRFKDLHPALHIAQLQQYLCLLFHQVYNIDRKENS